MKQLFGYGKGISTEIYNAKCFQTGIKIKLGSFQNWARVRTFADPVSHLLCGACDCFFCRQGLTNAGACEADAPGLPI